MRYDFALTGAEQRIARLVAEGQRLGEAAEKLGISFNIARAHMEPVYAKTDTEHQSGFLRMLFADSDWAHSPTPAAELPPTCPVLRRATDGRTVTKACWCLPLALIFSGFPPRRPRL